MAKGGYYIEFKNNDGETVKGAVNYVDQTRGIASSGKIVVILIDDKNDVILNHLNNPSKLLVEVDKCKRIGYFD